MVWYYHTALKDREICVHCFPWICDWPDPHSCMFLVRLLSFHPMLSARRTYSSRKVENASGLVPRPLHTPFLEMTKHKFSHTMLILILSKQTLIRMKSLSQLPCLSVLSPVIQQQTSVTTSKRELLYFPRMFTRTGTWRPWKKKIRNGRRVATQHTFMTRPMSGIGMFGKETKDNSCLVSAFPKTYVVCGSLATIILIVP